MLSERGARHKNVSTVWFCLSEVQEWKKIIYTDKTGKAVTSGKESEGTFWKLEKFHVLIWMVIPQACTHVKSHQAETLWKLCTVYTLLLNLQILMKNSVQIAEELSCGGQIAHGNHKILFGSRGEDPEVHWSAPRTTDGTIVLLLAQSLASGRGTIKNYLGQWMSKWMNESINGTNVDYRNKLTDFWIPILPLLAMWFQPNFLQSFNFLISEAGIISSLKDYEKD